VVAFNAMSFRARRRWPHDLVRVIHLSRNQALLHVGISMAAVFREGPVKER